MWRFRHPLAVLQVSARRRLPGKAVRQKQSARLLPVLDAVRLSLGLIPQHKRMDMAVGLGTISIIIRNILPLSLLLPFLVMGSLVGFFLGDYLPKR